MRALESPQVVRPQSPIRKPVQRLRADLRVRYAETDQMGKAHHMHYLAWFELGRMELLRANGILYAELERADVMLPVTKAEVEYRQSACCPENRLDLVSAGPYLVAVLNAVFGLSTGISNRTTNTFLYTDLPELESHPAGLA